MSLMTQDAFIACLRLKSKTIYILAALVISLVASFCIVANTHAAGTADVKTVFGAKGDGVTDDTDAIQAAFNSDYDIIEFPKGEYHYTKVLTFNKGNKTINGSEATLFTDDDFSSTTGEFSIRIQGTNASNMNFHGLRFEARQTENDAAFKTLIGVMSTSEIHFDNCDFLAVRGIADTSMHSVDFYSGWHNVSMTNSRIDMFQDNAGMSGGGVYFRDVWGQGANNAVFANNIYYKYGHDEAIWISESQAGAIIDNIEIAGNRIYIGDPVLSQNVYTITLNTNAPSQLKNIHIHDNEILGQGNGRLIQLEGSENVDIYSNDLYAKVNDGGSAYGAVVGSGAQPNTPDTVNIRNNRTVTLDSPIDIAGITTGYNPFNFTDNPRIVINAPNSHYLVNHNGAFSNNNVVVNGNAYRSDGGGVISSYAKNVQNNNILINGFADVFFRNWGSNLSKPAVYTGNTITTTQKSTVGSGNTRLIHMWGFSMNGHPITFSDNTFINGSEVELDNSIEAFAVPDMGSNTATDRSSTGSHSNLWWMNIADAVPTDQTLNFCNNTTQGFRIKQAGRYPTLNLTCN